MLGWDRQGKVRLVNSEENPYLKEYNYKLLTNLMETLFIANSLSQNTSFVKYNLPIKKTGSN
jgi:hypothetical protein